MDFAKVIDALGPTAAVIPAVVIAGASIFDALVPLPKEGTMLFYVKKVVAFLAVNFGNAKNAR